MKEDSHGSTFREALKKSMKLPAKPKIETFIPYNRRVNPFRRFMDMVSAIGIVVSGFVFFGIALYHFIRHFHG